MKSVTITSLTIAVSIILTLSSISNGFAQLNKNSQTILTEYVSGTIIIKVKEGIGPFQIQEKNIRFGIASLDEKVIRFNVNKLEKRFKHKDIPKSSGLPDLSRIYRIHFPNSLNIHEVAKVFSEDLNIVYAEPMPIGKFSEIPNDPSYNTQQHLPQIMASQAWDVHKGENGDEIIVAIIDTGTDWLHPDLTNNCWQNLGEDADGDGVTLEFNNGVWERDPDDLNGFDDDGNGYIDDVIGWDFHEEVTIGDGSNPDPLWFQGPYEHGTHCAGISSGVTNNAIGIASVSWNIKYMPVQTDDGNNTVLYGIDGIIYAAENGADIISNSWTHGYIYSQYEYEALQYAIGLGSIVCFAAANGNTSDVALPSGYPGVISVAAVNPDDTRAGFSNYGISIDIAAPGVSILSTLTNNSYASWDGTSMATPMVAGLFGLLKSYQPSWTNEQLIEQLIGTADNIDGINPDYEKALGSGRINAYHALVDENIQVPQELRLEFLDFSFEDENNDSIIQAGETVSVSFSARNYAPMVSGEALFFLSSVDTSITILTESITATIPADSAFKITSAFEFQVAENAPAHLADFIIEVSSDMAVTYGFETEIAILVAPSGFFVWEGYPNETDYSGTFIAEYLKNRGHQVLYSNSYPQSFSGFDAVFLSFGNAGENVDEGTFFDYPYSIPIQEYLENGGKLYSEGSPFLFLPGYLGYPNGDEFANLFGVDSATINFTNSNPISQLIGIDSTLFEGMTFNNSHQLFNWYIDMITPSEDATVSFYEEEYGNVSVYNEGDFGQKTFHFAYSLSELVDEDPHSSRYNIMRNVMEFFGYPEGDGFVVANFAADQTEGKPDFEVQFTDWSIAEQDTEITDWAWDFNEDGDADSFDQNPVWTYSEGGVYDVTLIVNSALDSDTLSKKDFITVRSGVFVFEGEENANGYSGTFIYDYIQNHWDDHVGYSNHFPGSLDGYEAVFLSYGNTGMRSTAMSHDMRTAIYSYTLAGGNVYLEGGDAMSLFGGSSWAFGLEFVEAGKKNELNDLSGQEDAITQGMQFFGTNQLSVRNIDLYSKNEDLPGAIIAFQESVYGHVAVEFDGTAISGQKTFCMSYALADLQDGDGINTRDELLKRILNFFNLTVGSEEVTINDLSEKLKTFPNPAIEQITIGFSLEQNNAIVIEIFDLNGRLISLKQGNYPQGDHHIKFGLADYSPGVYFIKIQGDGILLSNKFVKMD